MKRVSNIFILLSYLIFNLLFLNLNSKNFALAQRGVSSFGNRVDIIDISKEIVLDLNDEIRSNIYLNGGKIKLEDDTRFVGDKFLQSTGTVNLQNYQIILGRPSSTVTSTIYWDGNKGSIAFDGRTYLTSQWTFSGSCMIEGNNNILDLTRTGSIIVERGSTLKLKNLHIMGMHGENINNLDEHCTVILENVTCDLSGDFDFNCGKCEIYKYVDLSGSYTFFYDSVQTITIHKETVCQISKDLSWSIRTKDSSGGHRPFYFEDKTSEIRIDSSRIKIGPEGVVFTRGWMGVYGKTDLELTCTEYGKGLQIGDGLAENDFEMVFYPASTVVAHAGCFVVDCVNPNSIKSLSGFSKLHRLSNNDFYIQKDFNMGNLSVYIDSPTNMYVADGATAYYDDCKFMFDGVKFETTSTRYMDSVLLLSGNQEIFIQEGKMPLYAMIYGSGNILHGSGSMSGKVMMFGADAELIYGLDGQMINDIELNDGTLTLERDLEFAGQNNVKTSGYINLKNNDFVLGVRDMTMTSTLYFIGDHGSINLNSTLFLTSQWTFSGACTLNGNGNILDFTRTGSLVFERGATIKLKNVHLVGMCNENVNSLDEDVHVILDNVVCDLGGDFDCNCGTFEIYNYLDINGSYTFYYDSAQSFTIHKQTVLEVSKDVSLALRTKNSSGGNTPFWFENDTAEIKFNNSTIAIGSAGVKFIHGIMGIEGKVYLDLNSTGSVNGIIIGDGTETGNFYINFYPAATFVASAGDVVINNADANSIVSLSDSSRLERLSGNNFYIQKDFNLNNLVVSLDSPTNMYVDDGVNAYYRNCRFVLPDYGVKFLTTSKRYMDSVLLLNGNEEIFIEEGNLPLYLTALNTGNKLHGSGSMSGAIILGGPGSEIKLGLEGQILNNITLNYGKVTLDKDIELAGNKFFTGSGTVVLGVNDLMLGNQVLNTNSVIYWDGNYGSVSLNAKLNLSSQWTFSNYCILNGKNHILDLTTGGTLFVERNSTLVLKDINVYGIQYENVECYDDSGLIILDNCIFTLVKDFHYNRGGCHVYNYVELHGEHDLYLDTNKTMSIFNHSTFALNKNITAKLRTINTDADKYPVWFEDDTSEFKADNSAFELGVKGAKFETGKMSIYGDVLMTMNSTDTSNGLHVGNGTYAGDFDMVFYPGATLTTQGGNVVIDSYAPDIIKSMSLYCKLIRKNANHFYIKNNFEISNITVAFDMDTTMDITDGKDVIYDQCNFEITNVKFCATAQRYSDSIMLLNGNDGICIQAGILPMYVAVNGAGNTLNGSGSMNGEIILLDHNANLSLSLDGQVLKSITLNGGRCTLAKDTDFGQGVQFKTTGTVDLGSSNLALGTLDSNCTCTLYYDSAQGSIDLNSMVTLSGTWTFSGNCTLNGNGNILWLKPTAQIIVERGSMLRLLNLRIKDLAGNNIKCLDDSGTIIFADSKTMLAGDYTFDTGKFGVNIEFEVYGNNSFIYSSPEISDIYMCSNFKFMPGTTFSYAPSTANKDLIRFGGSKSKLCLDSATLHSTETGIRLIVGTLEVAGESHITSDATCLAEGIVFGDGINVANNFNFEPLNSALLNLASGHLVYDNVV